MFPLEFGKPFSHSVTALCFILCLESSAVLTQTRNSARSSRDTTCELPDDFSSVLTLEEERQHSAYIFFNKTSFELFYKCMFQTTTCWISIKPRSGTYMYNAQTAQTDDSDFDFSEENVYKTYVSQECEIPNFSLLSNKGGGYITCTPVKRSTDICTTGYWSVHIDNCELGPADIIWKTQRVVSWTSTPSDLSIPSKCTCNRSGKSNCMSDAVLSTTGTTPPFSSPRQNPSTTFSPSSTNDQLIITSAFSLQSQISSSAYSATNTTAALEHAQSQDSENQAAVIGGAVTAAVVVVVVLLIIAYVIWKRRAYSKQPNGPTSLYNFYVNRKLSEHNNSNAHGGPSLGTVDHIPSTLETKPGPDLAPSSNFQNHGSYGRESTISSGYTVIGNNEYESLDGNITPSTTAFNNNKNSTGPHLQKQYCNIDAPPYCNIDNPVIITDPANNNYSNSNCNSANNTVFGDGDKSGYTKLGDEMKRLHNPYNKLSQQKDGADLTQQPSVVTEHLSSLQQEHNPYSLAQTPTNSFINRPIQIVDVSNKNALYKDPGNKKTAEDSAGKIDGEYPAQHGTADKKDPVYFELEKDESEYNLDTDHDSPSIPDKGHVHHSYLTSQESLEDGSRPEYYSHSHI